LIVTNGAANLDAASRSIAPSSAWVVGATQAALIAATTAVPNRI
jgi:hypothetical protein